MSGAWRFLLGPAVLWVTLLFVLSLVFSFTRRRAGSILGPIAAHAGYNLGMNYFIFYHLL